MNLETKYKLIEKLMQTNDEAALNQVNDILESVEIIGYEGWIPHYEKEIYRKDKNGPATGIVRRLHYPGRS